MKQRYTYRLLKVLPILLLVCSSMYLFGQSGSDKTTRILFVLDASNSMTDRWESSDKWTVATRALGQVIDSLKYQYNVEFALRVYGHQVNLNTEGDCKDSRKEVSFSKTSALKIKTKLDPEDGIEPKGATPISYSLGKAAGDFPPDIKARNIVILITDGIESCNGDPCSVSMKLQKAGVFLRPYVISMNISPDHFKMLDCIGKMKNVVNQRDFYKTLMEVVTNTISETTAEVDLLDTYYEPIETGVNMSFYNTITNSLSYNFYHTMNARGNPDTMYLETINKYDLTVHTIPPIHKKDITIDPKIHNKIEVDAAQGEFIVKLQQNNLSSNIIKGLQYIVRRKGEQEIIDVQKLNTLNKYLVGTYDIEILTIPRMTIRAVEISQIKTTTLELAVPGMVNITSNSAGYGGIFKIEDDGKLTKIYSFQNQVLREILAMQPGAYKAIFRAGAVKEASATIEKNFVVESNGSIALKLY